VIRLGVTEALDLLFTTAANSATGCISSVTTDRAASWTYEQARVAVSRAGRLERSTWLGQQILVATLPGHGQVTWFLNLQASPVDPWA
jgi:hypothetical protein